MKLIGLLNLRYMRFLWLHRPLSLCMSVFIAWVPWERSAYIRNSGATSCFWPDESFDSTTTSFTVPWFFSFPPYFLFCCPPFISSTHTRLLLPKPPTSFPFFCHTVSTPSMYLAASLQVHFNYRSLTHSVHLGADESRTLIPSWLLGHWLASEDMLV